MELEERSAAVARGLAAGCPPELALGLAGLAAGMAATLADRTDLPASVFARIAEQLGGDADTVAVLLANPVVDRAVADLALARLDADQLEVLPVSELSAAGCDALVARALTLDALDALDGLTDPVLDAVDAGADRDQIAAVVRALSARGAPSWQLRRWAEAVHGDPASFSSMIDAAVGSGDAPVVAAALSLLRRGEEALAATLARQLADWLALDASLTDESCEVLEAVLCTRGVPAVAVDTLLAVLAPYELDELLTGGAGGARSAHVRRLLAAASLRRRGGPLERALHRSDATAELTRLVDLLPRRASVHVVRRLVRAPMFAQLPVALQVQVALTNPTAAETVGPDVPACRAAGWLAGTSVPVGPDPHGAAACLQALVSLDELDLPDEAADPGAQALQVAADLRMLALVPADATAVALERQLPGVAALVAGALAPGGTAALQLFCELAPDSTQPASELVAACVELAGA